MLYISSYVQFATPRSSKQRKADTNDKLNQVHITKIFVFIYLSSVKHSHRKTCVGTVEAPCWTKGGAHVSSRAAVQNKDRATIHLSQFAPASLVMTSSPITVLPHVALVSGDSLFHNIQHLRPQFSPNVLTSPWPEQPTHSPILHSSPSRDRLCCQWTRRTIFTHAPFLQPRNSLSSHSRRSSTDPACSGVKQWNSK